VKVSERPPTVGFVLPEQQAGQLDAGEVSKWFDVHGVEQPLSLFNVSLFCLVVFFDNASFMH